MKIHKIEIHNIRGVRDLTIEPDGKSFVVYGPNGSGKSAVVDAIDFLFTGRISRLMGRGTSGITLSKYGPHIDVVDNPEDAWVNARIKIESIPDFIEIKRTMDNPSNYICDDKFRPQLDEIMEMARRGQHILSRKEVLKYIAEEKGVRGKEIQNLMKLNDVEKIRKTLVKLVNDYFRLHHYNTELVRRDAKKVSDEVGIDEYDEVRVLKFINEQRKLLGGKNISDLAVDSVRSDLPSISESEVNAESFEESTNSLLILIGDGNRENFENSVREFHNLMDKLSSDRTLVELLQNKRLLSLGLSSIDETGKCPLCEYEWPTGKIKSIIEKRLENTKQATLLKNEIDRIWTTISDILGQQSGYISKNIEILKNTSLISKLNLFEDWKSRISEILEIIDTSISQFSIPPLSSKQIISQLIPSNIEQELVSTLNELKKQYPTKSNPKQDAWDKLVSINTQLNDMNESMKQFEISAKNLQKAEILKQSFITARDSVLGSLFETVQDRFVELYCMIHNEDEADFTANLKLEDDATCEFLVDFYGRDLHPPHALHSEGHQDCMGLCLYLAIAENLSEGVIDLIVLDDVVMSIDTDHRRGICDIINNSFTEKQFLITSHDKTWAYQLKKQLQLEKKRFRQFSNWSIELGPETEFDEPIWNIIYSLIDNNQINTAAARLRRWLEQFLGNVCSDIRATTRHKLDGQHELGDLLKGAQSRYGQLLKQAKNAANSWNDQQTIAALEEAESIRKQILQRIGTESWSVNSAIHYNEWENFSKSDFRPVVEAFEDFCNLFICPQCLTNLQVALAGEIEKTLTCDCSGTSWNLKMK